MRKALIGLVALAILGVFGFLALTSPSAYRLIRPEPAARGRPHSGCGERPHPVLRRRLHLLPCGSQSGGQAAARRRLCAEIPLRHLPRSQYLAAQAGRHRLLDARADFVRAMREGVSPDGRHYYPAFPYASYQRMSPEDLGDLFAFMQTLPAVEGRAPGHDLPFPFNIRRGVGLWKLAFLDGQVFRPDPSKPASWNRGAYLVNGPGHCAECHSERNFAGGIVEDRRFAGGPDPEGGRGTVPNITPHQSGIGGWSPEEVATLLKTGETPNFDTVGGPMGAVVANTAQLPDADRQAMAEYLLSLPPRVGFKKPE